MAGVKWGERAPVPAGGPADEHGVEPAPGCGGRSRCGTSSPPSGRCRRFHAEPAWGRRWPVPNASRFLSSVPQPPACRRSPRSRSRVGSIARGRRHRRLGRGAAGDSGRRCHAPMRLQHPAPAAGGGHPRPPLDPPSSAWVPIRQATRSPPWCPVRTPLGLP